MDFKVNTIEEAIKDFKEGKFVIVVDDEDRENEGDLIIAAEKVTDEKVNFMLKNARGVLCAERYGRKPPQDCHAHHQRFCHLCGGNQLQKRRGDVVLF